MWTTYVSAVPIVLASGLLGLKAGVGVWLIVTVASPLVLVHHHSISYGLALRDYGYLLAGMSLMTAVLVGHIHDLHSRLSQLRKAVRDAAMTDHLSGLYNRSALYAIAEKEFERVTGGRGGTARARPTRKPNARGDKLRNGRASDGNSDVFACAVLDIDEFRELNERFGYKAGDEVIRGIGAILMKETSIRKADFAARFSAEKFLLLFPETSAVDAQSPVRRVFDAITSAEFAAGDGSTLTVKVSIGLSQLHQVDTAFDQLLHRAEHALRQAKAGGKNRIVLYENPGSESPPSL
jgi:diguanylate cyclase (GGDEF)-like protein